MQENPIYKFLKENNLTTKDEGSFLKEYSDPNKAKELHGFLVNNNLTTKDEASFYDTYFKKKNLGGIASSPTESQSVSKSFISSLPEQKSIYAPTQKLASESTTVVAPKEAKLISEANKRGEQITKEAISNSNDLYLKSQNKGGYKFTKEDPSILNNKKELEQDLKDGTLQVVKSPKTGKYVLAYKADMLKSFSQAWDGVLEKQANDKYVAGLSTEDKIKHYEAQDILNQDKYLEAAPSGFSGSVGRLLGENAEPLIKLAAMANIGGKAAQAAGATAQTVANAQKFGSFLAFATDAGYSGYANNTERVYKSLRKQDPNGDPVEQMRKAENAGLIGEASGIGMAAGMTGIFKNLKGAAETINTKPFVSALETMAKHTSKEAAVQGSISALNSIVSDLGAKSQGLDIGVGNIVENALESGKQMAQFVGVTGLAMGTLTGLMKVPGYVKAQAKGLVSELPREEVKAVYEGAEANGIIPEGTTDKVINSLNQYDKAKEKLPEGLTEDKKASLTGIQEKIDKLEESKKKLAPQYHDRVDNTIKSLKDRAIKILESKDPLGEEVDNILNTKGSEEIAGPPVTEADLIEEVSPTEIKITEKVKPIEVDLTSPEKMNASQNRYGIVKDGKEAGFIVTTNPENNVVKIKGVTVNEGLRGKGLAGDAYVKLGESLSKEGISLESDSFDKMEPSATRVWEKLSDKGLAIKGENSYRFNPLEVKPIEQKVTIELLSSEEPPQKQGETIVTLSGKTETERLESIDRRKRETKVSDKVVAENDLIQDAESYFKKDGRYKNSSEGRNELNNLRIKARELGLEIDTDRDAVTRRNKAGRPTKVSYNNKADGEAVVDPNGRTITERSREVQDAFEELTDAGVFLDVETELGKRMSASQIDAAVKDILDGIPSKRAEKYLNALEKAIAEDAFPLYDKTFGDIAPRLSEIRDQLGIEREVIGEPMDEVALNKFLDEESRLTPEEEQTLLDNVENLLNEYETTQEGPQGEVQPIEARAEEGIPAKTEPVAEAKAAGEAPKPVKEVYDEFSSKKSELAKKKIINDNFDTIVEDLIKNKKIERIC
jgi:predicted GNAT family acetyltransferase/peptidoglycan hydrolase-like protein with peptidoglycan-binding domain